MPRLSVVNSGGANLSSVLFALDRLGITPEFTEDPDVITSSDKVILPGVGHAAHAMKILRDKNLIGCLKSLKQPVIGICLGMQLLYSSSEEGDVECLDIIPGRIQEFSKTTGQAVPHMGWNTIKTQGENALLKGMDDNPYAYFVHSYAAPVSEHTIGKTEYIMPFTAMVKRDNFYGCQFHPERSGEVGETILRNFLEI